MKVFLYCFKVWFTTLVIATFILGLISGNEKPLSFMLFGVLLGGGLSVPGFLLLWLSATGLIYYRVFAKWFKISLSIISAILCLLPLTIGRTDAGINNFYLSIPYIIISIICVWYYKASFIRRIK